MKETLQDIFSLEDNKQFELAFDAYNNCYSRNKNDYEIWKHFYFFLWTVIEDAPNSFHEKIDLRHLLQVLLDEGKYNFSDKADFNFIAGYTVSIFPYEYGDSDDLEDQAKEMLLKASQLEPGNLIYKLIYIGSNSSSNQQVYRQAKIDAAPKILEVFSGNGALNNYFTQVLYKQ
ncbi:hypothetical protein [Hymenobacter sp.]|jgi:hypothetical protein|uniref:hypothetical protein n=1 Tax=Hymenobacter sp. TaxID=1898978 RepID=UPI002EDA1C46